MINWYPKIKIHWPGIPWMPNLASSVVYANSFSRHCIGTLFFSAIHNVTWLVSCIVYLHLSTARQLVRKRNCSNRLLFRRHKIIYRIITVYSSRTERGNLSANCCRSQQVSEPSLQKSKLCLHPWCIL